MDEKEMEEFIRSINSEREARMAERSAKLRNDFMPELKRRNVSEVVLDYDGYGDSTSESGVAFRSADGDEISKDSFSLDENELVDILFEFVPPGYENNDGGYGQVILNVQTGKMRNEHAQRYTESHYSEEEFDL